jgi:hypothetical protein
VKNKKEMDEYDLRNALLATSLFYTPFACLSAISTSEKSNVFAKNNKRKEEQSPAWLEPDKKLRERQDVYLACLLRIDAPDDGVDVRLLQDVPQRTLDVVGGNHPSA